MSRPSKGQRRQQGILEAASLTLIDKGYGDTRVADVAERAGVSTALVMYYFGTREQLLLAALQKSEADFYEEATERLSVPSSAWERLIILIDMVCESDERTRTQRGIWFEIWSQAQRHPEIAEARTVHDKMWRNLIAHVIREGQLSGEIARSVSPEKVAILLATLLDGMSVQLALSDPEITLSVSREATIEMAAKELGLA